MTPPGSAQFKSLVTPGVHAPPNATTSHFGQRLPLNCAPPPQPDYENRSHRSHTSTGGFKPVKRTKSQFGDQREEETKKSRDKSRSAVSVDHQDTQGANGERVVAAGQTTPNRILIDHSEVMND